MFDAISRLLGDLVGREAAPMFDDDDPRLGVAALLVHAVAVDGRVTESERAAVVAALGRLYGLGSDAAEALRRAGLEARALAVDAGTLVDDLAERLTPVERRALVVALWQAVYADGAVHEFEEDLLWRVVAPLGIGEDERAALRAQGEAAGRA